MQGRNLIQEIKFQLRSGTMTNRLIIVNVCVYLLILLVKKSFLQWTQSQEIGSLDWLSADGKSLKSTLSDYSDSSQDFCSIVSMYVQKTGLTYAIADFRNKKVGEAEIVRLLLPSIKDKGVILTLDALHTQKKQ